MDNPPAKVTPPPLRRDFLALADAHALLARQPSWSQQLRGDLQMHTQ
jgi:hypothetical protein